MRNIHHKELYIFSLRANNSQSPFFFITYEIYLSGHLFHGIARNLIQEIFTVWKLKMIYFLSKSKFWKFDPITILSLPYVRKKRYRTPCTDQYRLQLFCLFLTQVDCRSSWKVSSNISTWYKLIIPHFDFLLLFVFKLCW